MRLAQVRNHVPVFKRACQWLDHPLARQTHSSQRRKRRQGRPCNNTSHVLRWATLAPLGIQSEPLGKYVLSVYCLAGIAP